MERLEEALEQRNRQLAAVFQITSALYARAKEGLRAPALDELLQETLQVALDVVNADAGTLYLANPERQTLVLRYVVGEKAEQLQGMEIPDDKGVAGEVFRTGQARITADVSQESAYFAEVSQRVGYEAKNMVTVPLRDVEGKPIGVLQALNKREGNFTEHDLELLTIVATLAGTAIETARMQQERQLALIARLLGNITHDIKNMLSPVLLSTQTLRTFYDSFRDQFQYVSPFLEEPNRSLIQDAFRDFDGLFEETMAILYESAEQLQRSVREIADAVKGAVSPPHFVPTSVNEVAEKVLLALKPVAQQQGVELKLDTTPDLPIADVDPHRLDNALYNLVNNAIPETPLGGSVTVRLRGKVEGVFPEGNYLQIEVIDTGRGIPPEVLQTLFTGRAVSTKAGGTGLGTQIVKNVVEAHGGTIEVESVVNKGTTVRIRLPLERPEQQNP